METNPNHTNRSLHVTQQSVDNVSQLARAEVMVLVRVCERDRARGENVAVSGGEKSAATVGRRAGERAKKKLGGRCGRAVCVDASVYTKSMLTGCQHSWFLQEIKLAIFQPIITVSDDKRWRVVSSGYAACREGFIIVVESI